ncbi:hypothetical protein VC83_02736 [Pseudogymnoascus destructans]|uniref:Uncharacterized protein n=1 Tax=Pseudogymnoascus destructans TaxID=655981 RepID=A0A177AG42_9PEZI|nr:uncharacterized protein VC83_02736 [Pseudogymnoascus destructans]OAF61086.1 hypothetical protein VC83_02736 [Pseudogymnoascus destructans]
MSLVFLKNLFLFSRPSSTSSSPSSIPSHTPASNKSLCAHASQTEHSPLLSSPPSPPTSTYSTTTTTSTDIESLTPSSHPSPFTFPRIDARLISDATIGLSDGLTVPFALTAGLSALGDTRVVIYGGLAELVAGAISMGLGGWLGAKSELASYNATEAQTAARIAAAPASLGDELTALFEPYDIPPSTLAPLTAHLLTSPSLLPFLMRIEHCLPPPSPHRALASALTIASAYFLGGLVPLVPYFFVEEVERGLWVSVAVMAVALWVFGWVKTGVCGGGNWERVKGGERWWWLGGWRRGRRWGWLGLLGRGDENDGMIIDERDLCHERGDIYHFNRGWGGNGSAWTIEEQMESCSGCRYPFGDA